MANQIVYVKGSVTFGHKTDSTVNKILSGGILVTPTFERPNQMENNSRKARSKKTRPNRNPKIHNFSDHK